MPKPRLLFLSQCLPHPPHSGVASRTFNVLKQLRTDFAITLVAFARRAHQPDTAARTAAAAALARLLDRVATPAPVGHEWWHGGRAWTHLRSVLARRPYTYYEYASRRFRTALRAALRGPRFDLVHVDSLDLYRWLDELPAAALACTHHNVESQLLRLQAHRLSPPLERYLLYQADLVEDVERALCGRFDVNVMMSERDAERLAALAPAARTLVVPNGVDTAYFTPPQAAPERAVPVPGRVVFVGPTYTLANRDAVAFLLGDVWPRVRARRPDASLVLIGGGPAPAGVRYAAHPGVVPLGRVPDIRPHLAQACCGVAPLRIGGGTRVKILDAWATGQAVVSTALGCEGLAAMDGENILVRDDAPGFADAVVEVLERRALRARLGAAARATVERCYSWDVVGAALRAHYHELIAPVRSRVAVRPSRES